MEEFFSGLLYVNGNPENNQCARCMSLFIDSCYNMRGFLNGNIRKETVTAELSSGLVSTSWSNSSDRIFTNFGWAIKVREHRGILAVYTGIL